MIITKKLTNGICVHGITTGTVAVKKEHYKYTGIGLLRIPKILFGNSFVQDMPIWVWVIETPGGKYLIDTGESTMFYQSTHFKAKKDDYVNRKILRVKVTEAQQINEQLETIGLSVDSIDAIIMTHLHVDHTDGISFFLERNFLFLKQIGRNRLGLPYHRSRVGLNPIRWNIKKPTCHLVPVTTSLMNYLLFPLLVIH